MEYTKPCPICQVILVYPEKYLYNRSIRENRACRSCATKQVVSARKILSLTRKCPECNVTLMYKVYHTWWWANKQNQVCRNCAHIGKRLSDATKQKISIAMEGSGNSMYGHHHTNEVKRLISVNNRGNKSKSGQVCSSDSKMLMRNAAIKRIKIQGTSRSYNPTACKYMDSLQHTFNFIHAQNSPDEFQFRGYFADGYDKTKNVWFEYDEPFHFLKDGNLKSKDMIRMEEIIKHLQCRFIRYNERKKLLTEFFSNGSQKYLTFPS